MTGNDQQSHGAPAESKDSQTDAYALSFSICFTWGYPDYMREALGFVVRTKHNSEPQNYVCTTWRELRAIVEDADSLETRCKIAGNPETPQAVLDYLAKLNDAGISRRVAENSRAHRSTLMHLSRHEHPDVRLAVAENAGTPTEALIVLSTDKSSDVRYSMASNAQMDEALLRMLIEDENPYVAARAAHNLQKLLEPAVVPQVVAANFARKTLQKVPTLKSLG